MPNGHGDRHNGEENLVESIEADGWELCPDPPDWIVTAAEHARIDEAVRFEARKKKYYRDDYVYLAVASVHGDDIHVFSQEKSEYRNTTPRGAICPECQIHVKRREDDDDLTCPRCGWQYKPLPERINDVFGED